MKFMALASAALLTACTAIPRSPSPTPTRSPAASPGPAPTPVAQPPRPHPPRAQPPQVGDWRDAPQTPGNWMWAREGNRSVARFGGNTLVLSCDRAARTITLSRPAAAQRPVPVTILTAGNAWPLTGTPVAGSPATIAATTPANNPMLDAMAFTRGRFAVETTGHPTLYVPSWPEVSRVIEDCR